MKYADLMVYVKCLYKNDVWQFTTNFADLPYHNAEYKLKFTNVGSQHTYTIVYLHHVSRNLIK